MRQVRIVLLTSFASVTLAYYSSLLCSSSSVPISPFLLHNPPLFSPSPFLFCPISNKSSSGSWMTYWEPLEGFSGLQTHPNSLHGVRMARSSHFLSLEATSALCLRVRCLQRGPHKDSAELGSTLVLPQQSRFLASSSRRANSQGLGPF